MSWPPKNPSEPDPAAATTDTNTQQQSPNARRLLVVLQVYGKGGYDPEKGTDRDAQL